MHPVEIARRRQMLSRFAPPPPAERGDHPDIRAIARIEVLAGELRELRRLGFIDQFAAKLAELARHLPEVADTHGVPVPLVQHQIGLEPGAELAAALDRVAELEAELAEERSEHRATSRVMRARVEEAEAKLAAVCDVVHLLQSQRAELLPWARLAGEHVADLTIHPGLAPTFEHHAAGNDYPDGAAMNDASALVARIDAGEFGPTEEVSSDG